MIDRVNSVAERLGIELVVIPQGPEDEARTNAIVHGALVTADGGAAERARVEAERKERKMLRQSQRAKYHQPQNPAELLVVGDTAASPLATKSLLKKDD